MAYQALNDSETTAGKPVKQELLREKIKGNFEDHEARLSVLEATTLSYPVIEFAVNGDYYRYTMPQTGACGPYRIPFAITITAARIILKQAGTAGTLEVDLLYKRGGGAYTSIFSTRPSIAYTAGDDTVSTNAVISTPALLAADILRMDITSTQTSTTSTKPGSFILEIEYQKT